MSKYFKLNPSMKIVEGANVHTKKKSSFDLKTFFIRTLTIVFFVSTLAITVLSFFSNILFFENIITGLFIVGCLLLIKSKGEEMTKITRVSKN